MKARLAKWLLLLISIPGLCIAASVKPDAPETYTVKKGDTLWDISSMYLDKPWQWPELWRNNTNIVNPHLIYPGDILTLVINQHGEAELALNRSPEVTKPLIKLSPQGKRVKKEAEPVPTLAWSVIEKFVTKDQVMSEDAFDALPVVLGDADAGIRFASGDLVITDKLPDIEGQYAIVRREGELIDLDGNVLGIHARYVAKATLSINESKDMTLVNVTDSQFEANRGDRLIPYQPTKHEKALGLVPANQQVGHILTNLKQYQLMGKYDVVALDLGRDDVVPGTVMGVYTQGPAINASKNPTYKGETSWLDSIFEFADEKQQPAIKVGELVVFNVFENSSYALITRSAKVIKRGAIVAHP
ncbi:LysM peptidoglycan-binding domain-containing protein [Neptunicella marina]|uniref:LysM peptidoglycan-binding domain-containing protein n=1 Tax=Neptunicella marina TaxID=2125989 RepID=A0A8J6M2R8_9ALTE|nr:LysM domain-containing protein [Neptunicella marina]MBC3766613.1 LysM peptidoglycan-binding domain-containing protein [Neptunicella marina]